MNSEKPYPDAWYGELLGYRPTWRHPERHKWIDEAWAAGHHDIDRAKQYLDEKLTASHSDS